MKSEKPYCQLIGAGRAGRALSIAMTQTGYQFTWIGSNKIEDSIKLARQAGIKKYGVRFEGFNQNAGFLILAVPDDKIKNVASDAARAGIIGNETTVAHLSGVLGSDELIDVRKAGAKVMAFHPAQTLTLDSDPNTVFKNIFFDMEGDDDACALGESVAKDLGARAIRLDPQSRVLSHLAMTVASNYSVSLIRMAEEIMISAGIPLEAAQKMISPLFLNTARNISTIGTVKSLTGPISRGDTEIIKTHLAALERMNKEYKMLYSGLARIALHIAVERGGISEENAEEIIELIGE